MKKVIFVILLAGLGVCVFAQNGVIKEFTGTVELKHAGAADYTAATSGAQIKADTIVSTGFKSTALIEVGSAIIAVRPLTRLTLTEIRVLEGSETVNMNLQAGRVRVDVKPPAGAKAAFTVTSPTSTASVRGTSFYFDTMNVSVREGTVAFKGNSGYSVMVSAGSFSGVGAYSVAREAKSNNSEGLVHSGPVGYDPATTGNIGETKVVNTTDKPNDGDIGIGIKY